MRRLSVALLIAALLAPGCGTLGSKSSTPAAPPAPRLVLFIGVDISGSFMHGKYFDDSLEFLARYIHAHLNGLGGLEVPHSLFVGSIGGATKALFPIEMFQDRTVEQIDEQLHQIFPTNRVNKYTDFNAFFGQVGEMIDMKKLLLKPISIVLLTFYLAFTARNLRRHSLTERAAAAEPSPEGKCHRST